MEHFRLTYIIDKVAKKKGIVVRHRNSGYSMLLTPDAEESKHWYVFETKGKNILNALRYSRLTFTLWEKSKIANPETIFKHLKD
jgi:hypothetical protein